MVGFFVGGSLCLYYLKGDNDYVELLAKILIQTRNHLRN